MDEPGRKNDEGPQHLVRITTGYWLADTACTQRLWEAVTGNNPSKLKADMSPVEQVSFDDIEAFLTQLNSMVPHLNAALPTEAQWEYACRAGTTTPFCFGKRIRTDQANYDGTHPDANSDLGVYRQKTVNVDELPANAWGLYQMHGNVYEFCRDGLREYTDEVAIDPRGPVAGTPACGPRRRLDKQGIGNSICFTTRTPKELLDE